MSDLIRVQRGHSPWRPADDAELLEEFRYYEVPLMGLIEQHGVIHYFECMRGADQETNFWMYAPIEEWRASKLRTAGSDDDFDEALADWHAMPFVLALAAEGLGIVESIVVESLEGTEVASAVDSLIKAFRDRSTRILEDAALIA